MGSSAHTTEVRTDAPGLGTGPRVLPLPPAALPALLAVCLGYHAVMLHAALTYDPERPRLVDPLHPVAIGKDRIGVDYYAYYQSGRNFLDGHSMFSVEGSNIVVPKPRVTPSPPLTGMAFALVNLAVDAETGRIAQIVLYEILLLSMVVLLARGLRLDGRATWLVAAMLLGFTPLYSEYYVGQLNVPLGFLLTVMLVAEERGQRLLSAMAWGISLALKPALLPLAALDLRRWRPVRLVVTGTILAVPTFAYFAAYPGTLELCVRHYFGGGFAQNVPGALGLFSFFLDAGLRAGLSPDVAIAVASGAGRGLGLVALLALIVDRRPDPGLWMCLLAITYGLMMGNFWEHSYVLMAPVCCYLLLRHGYRSAFWVWALLAIPTPFAAWKAMDVDYVRPYAAAVKGFRADVLVMAALHHASKAVPLLVLWAILVRDRFAARRGTAAPPSA